ncbi:hypothetical protein C8R47DRAFT_1078518 [Mycena vitilis]|nr:hypothetical protein C8R47DRAFT_1078518 [Mycena vitilis]
MHDLQTTCRKVVVPREEIGRGLRQLGIYCARDLILVDHRERLGWCRVFKKVLVKCIPSCASKDDKNISESGKSRKIKGKYHTPFGPLRLTFVPSTALYRDATSLYKRESALTQHTPRKYIIIVFSDDAGNWGPLWLRLSFFVCCGSVSGPFNERAAARLVLLAVWGSSSDALVAHTARCGMIQPCTGGAKNRRTALLNDKAMSDMDCKETICFNNQICLSSMTTVSINHEGKQWDYPEW